MYVPYAHKRTLNLLSDFGRRGADRDACLFHRLDLVRGLARAAGNDRARVAHAASGRRRLPGDESDHRLLHVRLHIGRGGLLRIAADLADHHDRVRVGILVEQSQRIQEIRADDRIAADADARRLPDSQFRQLAHRFIGQRAGARNHAHVAFLMNVPGHDADLAFARRNDARAVGPDQPRRPALRETAHAFTMSSGRDAFRDAHHQRQCPHRPLP